MHQNDACWKRDMNGFCGVKCNDCIDYTTGKCTGCKSSNGLDETCFFVRCNMKHETAYCNECTKFPCDDIIEFSEESESHRKAYEWLKNGEMRL